MEQKRMKEKNQRKKNKKIKNYKKSVTEVIKIIIIITRAN